MVDIWMRRGKEISDMNNFHDDILFHFTVQILTILQHYFQASSALRVQKSIRSVSDLNTFVSLFLYLSYG